MKKNEIFELIDRFEQSKLTSLTIEQDGTKLSLEQGTIPVGNAQELLNLKSPQNLLMANQLLNPQSGSVVLEKGIKEIKSPLVGTFYSAPSPGAAPYAKIGQKIQKGDVIGIIEAMKLMNEVTAAYTGIMSEILVEDESLVQYDQILFKIKENENV